MTGSYEALFASILADVDAEMRKARQEQAGVAPLLWDIIDYQFGWDAEGASLGKNVSGKKIRPVLMALVARAVCGEYQHVLPAGAALEFLHNFTLIHDDVMDRSLERRHRPAVWVRWSSDQAINAGDGLYALANLTVSRLLDAGISAEKVVRVGHVMSQACLWTAEGQVLDIDFERRNQVTPDDYITMITHKTGTLIEAAAKIGALLSTGDEQVVMAYAAFGRSLGVAFQVRDDYLGVWGDETRTGKPATSDIREKKKTYPVLVAFEKASGGDRETLARIYGQEALTDGDVAIVLEILARVGAETATDRVARQYYEAAMNHLDATGIANDTQDLIRQYAAFLIRRAY